ncbi:MAG TPA: YraN family protein [Kiloniellales bacterium]
MASHKERRRLAYGRGRRAELMAAWWLRLKGYRILARGFRVPVGEIDLIARRGRTLALVEVKARPDLATAHAAIGPRQRRRVARAAASFLQRNPALAECDVRFDVVLLAPGRRPRHLAGAWRSDDA